MATRKSTLKNIVSSCVVALSITLTSFFLRFSKELQKEPPKACGQSEIFQGRGGFGELEHFDKHFDKKEHFDKKGHAGENFGVFFS